MKKFHINALAIAAAASLGLGGAIAQTGGAAGGTSGTAGGTSGPSVNTTVPATGATARSSDKASKVARGDEKFMTKAAEDGMFEVEVAKVAAGKATSPEVKAFATMMVDDHTKANSELMQLASSKGVQLPTAMPAGKRRDLDKMNKLTGAKFDQEFAQEVGINDHKKDIKLFESQSKEAKDPELKAWVDKTLPTLRTHLDHATKLPQNKGKG